MDKTVIIINGKGGVGKDTLCECASRHFKVWTISSVDIIKEMATIYAGWDGQKDAKSRKFLADLKRLFTDYNDAPFTYLCHQYANFEMSDAEILFVHIREPREIRKFMVWVRLHEALKVKQSKTKVVPIECYTLLIRRDTGVDKWGNAADDQVEDWDYDRIYVNDKPLEKVEDDFVEFLRCVL